MNNEQRFKMKQRDLYATMKLVAFLNQRETVSAVRVETATPAGRLGIDLPD